MNEESVRTLRKPHRTRLLLVAALLTAAGCHPEPPSGVRVVLITLDTLRYDRLKAEPDAAPKMPHVAERARRGLAFRHSYASTPETQPTHATLFTALHPWEHGITTNGAVLRPEVVTVAEILKAQGFQTAAVVASFPLHHRFGFGQGFDTFVDDFTHADKRHWEGIELKGQGFHSLADVVTDRAIDLLDDSTAEKQFFWFHYFDPHAPYGDEHESPMRLAWLIGQARNRNPEAPDLVRAARRLYDEDVARLDRSLDRLLARLEADGMETHVVLTADHGESLGEGGLLGHGKHVTREQVRVPLVILSPRVEAKVRADTASSIDVAATLLSLANIANAVPQGRDLTAPPTVRPEAVLGMRRTFDAATNDLLVDGTDLPLPRVRFFLAEGEMIVSGDGTNVAAEATSKLPASPRLESTRALFAGLEERLSELGAAPDLGDEAREGLEALGYLP
jgi:arylsulfatase A-like enzyme